MSQAIVLGSSLSVLSLSAHYRKLGHHFRVLFTIQPILGIAVNGHQGEARDDGAVD